MPEYPNPLNTLDRSLNALEFPLLRDELVRLAETEPAREILREISPRRDITWIKNELRRTDEVKGLMDRGVSHSTGGVTDIRVLLKRISVIGSVAGCEELLSVLYHLRVYQTARRMLDREQRHIPLVFKACASLQPVPVLEDRLSQVLSPEATLRDNASPQLAKIRRELTEAQQNLRNRMSSLTSRLVKQGLLQGDSYTIRDGRYVLPLRSESFRKVRGIVHDRSATGGTVFLEPSVIVELGNELRSMELAERDEIRRILAELTDQVRRHLRQIEANLEVITAIDCLWAKARLAEILDAYPPAVNEEGPLRIVQGRHPLLVLTAERSVVPLDLEHGVDWTCLIVSGPNAGGKSVALKCVGLFCVMTACGLHLPALPGTEIPVFDDYFAVIGDEQSISDDLSTFSAHTVRLKEIITSASEKSLVLVDEIGAGTDPQEGACLSIATLEILAERRVPTIVTTHHGILKAFAYKTPSCANGSMAFDHDTFQPTYRFQANLPGSSYALDIARRVGIPDEVIQRAKEILGTDRTQLDELIQSLSERIRKYESLVHGEQTKAVESEGLAKAYREKLQRLQTREKELKKIGRQQIEEVVREARRTVEAVVRDIRESNASRESIIAAQERIKSLSRKTGDVPEKSTFEEAPPVKSKTVPQPPSRAVEQVVHNREPRVGDWVRIDDTTTTGEVTAFSSKGDRLCVAVGTVQLWIKTDRVKVVEALEQPKQILNFITLPEVPFELDVRGLDSAEALERVERYLYDGAAAGRESLGIIHGKGMGILSSHIRNHLKNHRVVDSFRFGEYGEGDYGITIVKLKK